MENKRILVIGGFGYIGREILPKLLENNYDITVISRIKRNTNYKTLICNILDKNFLLNNVKDFDIVIYLAAIVRSLKKSRYEENITGLNNVLEVMKINKINKIIYFSTQNVYLDKTGPYGESKKECDNILINSKFNYIIIRPNYVYGIDKENDFYKLFKLIKTFKICPIIGNGDNKIQPVNKEDIASITISNLKNFKNKTIIDVSGKNTVTINQIVEFIKKEAKIRCLEIYIPIKIIKFFKYIVPFDVDGFDKDRISLNSTINIKHDIFEDLMEIIKL